VTGEDDREPVLRVVRGDLDDEEVAALVVALVVAAGAVAPPSVPPSVPPSGPAPGPSSGPEAPSARPGRWADPARRLGRAAPGPGSWESSALPR
jgi:Acyl-CoA carboxylase epsilon subunit